MKLALTAFFSVWIAAGLQGVATRFSVFGASPDFVILMITLLALFASRPVSGVIGFLGGLFQGAMVGASLAGYIVSRVLVGFFTGWISNAELNKSLYVAPFVVAASTIAGQIILLFIAPTPAIGSFLLGTIGTAIYNGVIAVPVFALLRRFLDPPRR